MSFYRVCGLRSVQLVITLAFLVLLIKLFMNCVPTLGKEVILIYPSVCQDSQNLQGNCISEVLALQKPTTEQIFSYFRWTNSTSCTFSADFGFGLVRLNQIGFPDGNKAVCLDPGVAPVYNNCLVYSFGIRNEWSFDEAMEEYGCDVFSFDPSMDVGDHQHSARIQFYQLGLSGENYQKGSWKMRTLSSIYEMLQSKHGQRIIDYLKIDIEWSEWETFPQLFESGILSKVKQLAMDVHLNEEATAQTFLRQYQMLRTLEEVFGFYKFSSRPNHWFGYEKYFPALGRHESIGFEMSWFNSNFLNHSAKIYNHNLQLK